jgi:cytosine/creatinine deaminase
MTPLATKEMIGLNLKLLGPKNQIDVLISSGKNSDKEKLLPAIRRLADLGVTLYATEGTSKFLDGKGIQNQPIYKITENQEPNILSYLEDDKFDLIVNILTGNNDYDQRSDSNRIRALAVENNIPLFTDPDVAILAIETLVRNVVEGAYQYKPADREEPWNLQREFQRLVEARGGYACHHAHFDKAYLISLENLELGQVDMQYKWKLYDHLKQSSSYDEENLIERIARGVETMIAQGAVYCRTMVDADKIVQLKPIKAALEVKKRFAGKIVFEVGVQPLQGVVYDAESRKYYEAACDLADFCGGLPSKDRPTPEEHLDIVLSIAKNLNKPIDVHVDQENNPFENETEQLAAKTIKHGMEGKVFAVHAISLAAKPKVEQDRVIKRMKDAGLSVIVCPSAALSMKSLDASAVLHNSIAPVTNLLDHGVPVYLGVDNVYDLFMPIVDGDMWFECRMLMESCRYYDLQKVASIATRRHDQRAQRG